MHPLARNIQVAVEVLLAFPLQDDSSVLYRPIAGKQHLVSEVNRILLYLYQYLHLALPYPQHFPRNSVHKAAGESY